MAVPTQRDIFFNIREWAPADLLVFLDQILVLMPGDLKYRLGEVLDALPPEGDNMHRVLQLVQSQWKHIQSQDWVEIAVVGPARTGKNSLVKALSRKQVGSSTPIFSVVDAQGLQEYLGYGIDQSLPQELRSADVMVLVLDGQFRLTDSTLDLYEGLKRLNTPHLVVLNKMDLVANPRRTVREGERKLGANIVGVSALRSETIETMLRAVVGANPKTLYPLTRNFPEFRHSICRGIITQAALASAVVGAIPIPVCDLLPITAIQTGMLLKVGRAFGFKIDKERARELLPMLAASLTVREAAHRLRSRFPDFRKLIAVSTAGLWTFLLGSAAVRYFEIVSGFSTEDQTIPQGIQ